MTAPAQLQLAVTVVPVRFQEDFLHNVMIFFTNGLVPYFSALLATLAATSAASGSWLLTAVYVSLTATVAGSDVVLRSLLRWGLGRADVFKPDFGFAMRVFPRELEITLTEGVLSSWIAEYMIIWLTLFLPVKAKSLLFTRLSLRIRQARPHLMLDVDDCVIDVDDCHQGTPRSRPSGFPSRALPRPPVS